MAVFVKAGLVFSLFLIILVLVRKLRDPKETFSWMETLFNSLIIFISSMLSFTILPWMIGDSYRYITYPRYQAEVVDVSTRRDDNGIWHHKILSFIDDSGERQEITSKIGSGEKPAVGGTETIKFANNTMLELNIAGILMTFAGLIMAHLLSLIPLYYLFKGFGLNTQSVVNYGLKFVIRILFPLTMAFFTGAFSYKLWLGFTDVEAIPIGAMMIMGFFTLVLIFSIFGFIKLAWGKEFSTLIPSNRIDQTKKKSKRKKSRRKRKKRRQ